MNAASSSTRWMVAGFLASFLGTSALLGSTTAFVAVGLLPLVWIPFYTTLETVEDVFAPIATKWLGRYDPGRVLVWVEVVDLTLTVVAVSGLVMLPAIGLQIFVGYLVIISILPLVVDVTEELFAGQVASIDRTVGGNFAAHLHSLIALVSLVIARPLGALAGGSGFIVVLIINAVSSAVAIGLRMVAVRRLAGLIIGSASQSSTCFDFVGVKAEVARTGGRKKRSRQSVFSWAKKVISYRELSPISSFLLAATNYLIGGYLIVWCASRFASPSAAVALFIVTAGLGNVLGPQLSRLLTARYGSRAFLLRLLSAYALILAVSALVTRLHLNRVPLRDGCLFGLMLFLIALCASASVTQLATRRAVADLGADRPWLVGWGQSFSALGALFGSWIGLTAGVTSAPSNALIVAAVLVSLMTWAYSRLSDFVSIESRKKLAG